MSKQIFNKYVKVDGIDIFYREAGDRKKIPPFYFCMASQLRRSCLKTL